MNRNKPNPWLEPQPPQRSEFPGECYGAVLLQFRQEFHESRVIAPSFPLAASRTQLIQLSPEPLWSEPQITIRRMEAHLTNVDSKGRKHSVQIGTVLNPCGQSMHCKRMPEIVQPRLVALPLLMDHSSDGTEPLKCFLQALFCDGFAVLV